MEEQASILVVVVVVLAGKGQCRGLLLLLVEDPARTKRLGRIARCVGCVGVVCLCEEGGQESRRAVMIG